VILIVAGAAGSGKTTVGATIAGQLGWRFADADTFHPRANVEKMRAGRPLADADRVPWLHAITSWLDERIAAGETGVVTCSALRRAYRDLLLDGRPAVTMAFLLVSEETLRRRVSRRPGHFFPGKLVSSQLATLEPPSPALEPRVHVIDAGGDTAGTASAVIEAVWPHGSAPLRLEQ
jgi:carbohydrate kinase (thermoresistant glucokinase family)